MKVYQSHFTLKLVMLAAAALFWAITGCKSVNAPPQPPPHSDDDAFAVNNIARWDGAQWHSLGTGLSNEENAIFPIAASVQDMAYLEGHLVVGGHFDFADARPFHNIALWDGNDWRGLGAPEKPGVHISDSDNRGLVRAIAVDPERRWIIVGGDFKAVYNQGGGFPVIEVPTDDLAIFSLETSEWIPIKGLNKLKGINSIYYAYPLIYVAGSFTVTNEAGTGLIENANNLAVYHIADRRWSSVADADPNARVDDIIMLGHDLYVTGNFTQLAGQSFVGQAVLVGGEYWAPIESEIGGNVIRKLEVVDGQLYALGEFIADDGRYLFARKNGGQWEFFGDLLPHGANYGYRSKAISAHQGQVSLGGYFPKMGGQTVNNLTLWDGSQMSEVGGGITATSPEAEITVNSIFSVGSDLYVGGTFTQVGRTE